MKAITLRTPNNLCCFDISYPELGYVYGVLKALIHEMKFFLQLGHTVKLDGFGNFHLTIESEMVDHKSDYRLDQHVKRVKCKFTPASHRVEGGKLSYYFCEGVELERKT